MRLKNCHLLCNSIVCAYIILNCVCVIVSVHMRCIHLCIHILLHSNTIIYGFNVLFWRPRLYYILCVCIDMLYVVHRRKNLERYPSPLIPSSPLFPTNTDAVLMFSSRFSLCLPLVRTRRVCYVFTSFPGLKEKPRHTQCYTTSLYSVDKKTV